jgi:hypothetical protein
MKCPYGGNCIDPGYPSDCEINSKCVNFKSQAEKEKFNELPDKYFFSYGNNQFDGEGEIEERNVVAFKTENQLRFFLADLPKSIKEQGSYWKKAN